VLAPLGPLGGPAAGPAAPGFAGSFQGAIQGTPATLSAQQQGDRITGTIEASGYRYTLDGRVTGTTATGTVRDPQTGAVLQFEASLAGDQVQFTLAAGDGQQLALTFQRGAGAAVASGGSPPPKAAPAAPAGAQRDPRLIGSWRYNEQLGDPRTGTMTVRWRLVIGGDGTYVYGSDTSQTRGHWRTQGDIVHVSEDGATWEPYARFAIVGGRLALTFGDNTRRVYHPSSQ
jgi:hypothetical protein